MSDEDELYFPLDHYYDNFAYAAKIFSCAGADEMEVVDKDGRKYVKLWWD